MRANRTSPIAKLTPAEPELHDVEPIVGISERDLNLLDAVYYQLALDASADSRPSTPEEDADVAWLMARARRRMSMSSVEICTQHGVRPALGSWKR